MSALQIKQKLKNGSPSIGSWIQIPSASTAELMGSAGFDWVAVDLEHGSISAHQLPDLFRAVGLNGTVPLARVGLNDPVLIKQALDAGAHGIIVPMVESADDVRNLNAWAKYPPEGKRGVGFSRANLFGRRFEEYFQQINQTLVLVAQLEHIRAVENIDAILGTGTLDAVIAGPYDLSGSMSLTGQFTHPDFLSAMRRIREGAQRAKVPVGTHVVQPDDELLEAAVADGYTFIAYSVDSVFLDVALDKFRRRSK